MNYPSAIVEEQSGYYFVKIGEQIYDTLLNVLQAENGGSFDNYAISSVYVEGDYYMALQKSVEGKEDIVKIFKLSGNDLEGFKHAVDTYNIEGASAFADGAESKGNLRF